jgi:hypothetical protein
MSQTQRFLVHALDAARESYRASLKLKLAGDLFVRLSLKEDPDPKHRYTRDVGS